MAISSIIPGWRSSISRQPPSRNGQPPQKKIDRAEHRADPLDAGEVELVAEPVHDHVAGHDHRDGQQQAPPEPAPEHLDVVPGVRAVAAVSAVISPAVVIVVVVVVRMRHVDGVRRALSVLQLVVHADLRRDADQHTPQGYQRKQLGGVADGTPRSGRDGHTVR